MVSQALHAGEVADLVGALPPVRQRWRSWCCSPPRPRPRSPMRAPFALFAAPAGLPRRARAPAPTSRADRDLALGSSAGWVRPGHLEHGDTRECQVPGDAGSVGTGWIPLLHEAARHESGTSEASPGSRLGWWRTIRYQAPFRRGSRRRTVCRSLVGVDATDDGAVASVVVTMSSPRFRNWSGCGRSSSAW